MNKKLIIILGATLLASALAVCGAQAMERQKRMGGGAGMEDGDGAGEAPGWRNERAGGVGGEEMGGGREGMGGRRGMRGGMGGPVSMDEKEVMAVIKKHDPAFAAKLAEQKMAAPMKYKVVVMMAGKILGMGKMENDEGLAGDAVRILVLESDTSELSQKYDQAAEADKAAIKAALKVKVAELFDLRLKGQELRLKRMEKEMARLKGRLDARKASKAKIVDERVGQLIGEAVGW